ncbi:sigma-70 family RNA polymerase sigma factor [Bacillus pseudomycoides]|uniref:Sigma-70 family RNA polymerase sigma factor n=1 Tax=Bacillus bingmayongensis TaxID=1150157 RepID=A0ABU5JUD0_9BACI|nr:sigma-70 family RNA polymerase sigma factor [Bacillus pseudomycoides]
MKDLIKQYNKTLRQLEKSKENATEADLKVIDGMISDIRYALEWMRTAKQPGTKRGIERRAAYQRDKLVNPLLMQRYLRSTETLYEWDDKPKESVISEWERIKLDDALSTLTEYEKEIFVMYKGGMFTQEEIAKLMEVTRSTIQQILRRADKKIAKQLSESLFCING